MGMKNVKIMYITKPKMKRGFSMRKNNRAIPREGPLARLWPCINFVITWGVTLGVKKKPASFAGRVDCLGAPGRIRTGDREFRRLVLCPAELPAHS